MDDMRYCCSMGNIYILKLLPPRFMQKYFLLILNLNYC